MILTWKKWTSFFIIAVLSFFACQFYAENHLSDFVSSPKWQADLTTELPGTFQKFKNLVQNVQGVTTLPWPIELGIVSRESGRFDPDHPQDLDGPTLMGLAIIEPQYAKSHEHNDSMECGHHSRSTADWFNTLSAMAIERATDAAEKVRLRQFQFYVQSYWELFDDQNVHLRRRMQDTRPADTLVAAAQTLDPRNSLYRFFSIVPELKNITLKDEPGAGAAGAFSLKDDVDPAEMADRIVSKLKTMRDNSGKLNLFQTYRLELKEKALRFNWNSHPQFQALKGHDLAELTMISHLENLRGIVTRLCFLGDRLSAKGEKERALAMYQHAYKIGEQLMLGDGAATPYFQVEVGRTLTSGVTEHLMAFWAGQGNVEKTLRAKELLDANQILIKREIDTLHRKGSDPLGYHEPTYEIYARSAGLTWWLGTTGIVFAGASLIGVAVFILLMRGQVLIKDEKLEISYKLLEMGMGAPIFVMILLTMIVPLKLEDFFVTGSLLTWMWILILLWLIFVGLLALFSGSQSEGIRRSPGRRIWIFTALGVAAGALVASVISDRMMPVVAVGIGSLVIGAGFFIWLVVILITWLLQRSPEDRRSRARANLAFSVCAMLASAVFLIASLASMPLTRYHQERYFNQATNDIRRETGFFLGDNWPTSFRGLPGAMFTIRR